jgi:hypothetical protein
VELSRKLRPITGFHFQERVKAKRRDIPWPAVSGVVDWGIQVYPFQMQHVETDWPVWAHTVSSAGWPVGDAMGAGAVLRARNGMKPAVMHGSPGEYIE